MRLIDANKLLEKSYEVGKWMPVLVVNASDIENAETIDAEPVRHGRWIPVVLERSFDSIKGIKCSECGEECVKGTCSEMPNYCRNCGAKMNSGD